jgi:malate dehydrogenase (oxaloacetate-decarboxylating)(NADP+)
VLDAGTNNESFLADPLYPGLRQKRVRGQAFDDFIAEFVQAVNEAFPKICIQWEDFAGADAVRILNTFKNKVCTFNDDVQGTAGVAAAGLLAASRFSGKPLKEQVFLFLGAGAAAVGIANLLAMKLELDGMDKEEALRHCWMFDVNGLMVKSRNDLAYYQKPFGHESEPTHDFVSAIQKIRPSAIIGVSTVGGAFNRQVVETMSAINERPIIFPYSNPTSHSECTAEQAYTWSKGKAIFASGSPFGPVKYNNQTFIPGQGNNVYIFPAMGLAIFATEARMIMDELFIVAAEALAEQVTEKEFAVGLIYPPVSTILQVSVKMAVKIAESIFDSGLSPVSRPENIDSFIQSKMFQAVYR